MKKSFIPFSHVINYALRAKKKEKREQHLCSDATLEKQVFTFPTSQINQTKAKFNMHI